MRTWESVHEFRRPVRSYSGVPTIQGDYSKTVSKNNSEATPTMQTRLILQEKFRDRPRRSKRRYHTSFDPQALPLTKGQHEAPRARPTKPGFEQKSKAIMRFLAHRYIVYSPNSVGFHLPTSSVTTLSEYVGLCCA